MAQVVITLKIMPESPDVDLFRIQREAESLIVDFAGKGKIKAEIEPVAFGLKAIKLIFVSDENKSNLEPLEESIKNIDGVESVNVVDVRRGIG